ncbi:MAG: hypothetical protein JO181_17865 [Solirubrobacterales bacterium]|nr:hypothetical protein [Solirubrobacterales bacterium]
MATLAVTAVLAGWAQAAPPRKQLSVAPTNPYWTLLNAQSHKALRFGARVGTCTFIPRASCVALQLPGQNLRGAFIPFGNLPAANLAGGSLAASTITHVNFRAANLNKLSFVGTGAGGRQLRRRPVQNTALTFAGFTNVDMCGVDPRKANLNLGAIVGADLPRR